MNYTNLLQIINTLILAATAGIVFWYAKETKRLREAADRQVGKASEQLEDLRQANILDATETIWKVMSNPKGSQMRAYIYYDFPGDLAHAAGTHLGPEFVDGTPGMALSRVKIDKVLRDVKENPAQRTSFERQLTATVPSGKPFTALEAVESTLRDFDIIALPVYLGVGSAKQLAAAYRSDLQRTADAVLPFVAIEKRLRGSSDPDYKKHYLKLLQQLGKLPEELKRKVESVLQ